MLGPRHENLGEAVMPSRHVAVVDEPAATHCESQGDHSATRAEGGEFGVTEIEGARVVAVRGLWQTAHERLDSSDESRIGCRALGSEDAARMVVETVVDANGHPRSAERDQSRLQTRTGVGESTRRVDRALRDWSRRLTRRWNRRRLRMRPYRVRAAGSSCRCECCNVPKPTPSGNHVRAMPTAHETDHRRSRPPP